MKPPYKHKLKYRDGKADFYHYGTVKEADISAEVIIVPGEMLDKHIENKMSIPLMGCAVHTSSKNYGDIGFNQTELVGKNIILIRDEVFELATKKELQELTGHEYGHIFHGHTTSADSHYDYEEQLADTFVDNPDIFNNLFKKWVVRLNKKCKKCQSDMKLDEDTVPNHWFIWCPKCANYFGDGDWNLFFLDNLVRKRVGLKLRAPEKKYAPIMPREANIAVEYMIREAKQFMSK